MSIIKDRKKELIEEFRQHENDTGSSQVQVAILTERINNLTEHFKKFKKDNHSRRGLIMMINKRRKLLDYLKSTEEEEYLKLIDRLKLRK